MSKSVKNVKSIGVINVVGSALARKVDCPVYTNVGREVAVGATKSFSHQILNLLAISVNIAEKKGFGQNEDLILLK
jgi:glucosamine--fructose-6-phosphate aminotransferase (isomerizing)